MKGSLENTLKALDTAFKNLSEALGKAFGPTLVIVIQDVTKGVNAFAGAMNAVPQPVMDAAGAAAKAVAQMLLLKKAIEAIIALRLGIAAMFAATATGAATAATAASGLSMNMRYLQGSMAAAQTQATGLVGVLKNLAAFGIITVGINLAVSGLQQVIAANLEIARLRGERQAGGAAAIYQGAAPIESKQAAQSTLAAIQKERQRLNSAGTIATGMLGPLAPLVGGMSPGARADRLGVLRERELRAAGTAALPTRVAPNAMGTQVDDMVGGGNGGGGAGGGRGGAASKAANEAERAAKAAAQEAARVKDVIRDRLAEGQFMRFKSEMQDRIANAEIAGDKMLAARLNGAQRELDIQYQYAQELAKEKDIDAQRAIIFEGQVALVANQREVQRELNKLQQQNDQDRLASLQKAIEKQYELNAAVQNQLRLADGVANTLGEGLGSAFNALIAGAQGWEKSLQQIASGVLLDIANQLIRIFVIEQAINAIKAFLTPFSPATPLGAGGGTVGKFGTLGPNYGIPQRAKGGPVSSGQTYMVGERGPELFVPGRSGSIVPNDKLGSGGSTSVVVNVDASGSKVEGNDQQGNQLGRVIAAAVQQELIKQKRPGGLLV
jgi:hypothetical protein